MFNYLEARKYCYSLFSTNISQKQSSNTAGFPNVFISLLGDHDFMLLKNGILRDRCFFFDECISHHLISHVFAHKNAYLCNCRPKHRHEAWKVFLLFHQSHVELCCFLCFGLANECTLHGAYQWLQTSTLGIIVLHISNRSKANSTLADEY